MNCTYDNRYSTQYTIGIHFICKKGHFVDYTEQI